MERDAFTSVLWKAAHTSEATTTSTIQFRSPGTWHKNILMLSCLNGANVMLSVSSRQQDSFIDDSFFARHSISERPATVNSAHVFSLTRFRYVYGTHLFG